MTRRALLVTLEVAVPALLLAGYALWASARGSYYFPPPGVITDQLIDLVASDGLHEHLLPSLRRLLLGYGLSVVLGVGLGLLLGTARLIRLAVQPVAEFLRSLPAVALIPFGMLVFGTGDAQKVFIIVLGAVWPILLNTIDGVRGTEPGMLEMARAYGIGPWARMRGIVIPAALPRVVAGMRTSVSIAIILMVVSEMVASRNGIGYLVLQSQRTFATSDMWAGIVLLGVIGYVANAGFVWTERRLLRWHRAARGLAT
jgi:ABC-type nitrate/sulfonate/bicarbonate transport system permease component